MSRRGKTVLAWTLAATCGLLAVPTVALLAVGSRYSTPADGFGLAGFGGLAFLVAALAFASTGAMIAARVPGNPIGWLFCITGLCIAVGDLAYQYADYALYIAPSVPLGVSPQPCCRISGCHRRSGCSGWHCCSFPMGGLRPLDGGRACGCRQQELRVR